MNYTFKYFDYDDLIDFLKVYPYSDLRKFISDNSKRYSKEIKGFRPNKLPPPLLYKIYCDEIIKTQNSMLEKFIINIAKKNFKDTKIEELVDTIEDNILETSIKIEEEVRANGLTVNSKHILKLAGIKINDDISKAIDSINGLIANEKEKTVIEVTNKYESIYDSELQNINKKYNGCLEEQKILKTKNKELIKSLQLSTSKLNKQVSENNKLSNVSLELEQKINDLEDEIKDKTINKAKLDELTIAKQSYLNKIQRLSKNIENLKIQLNDNAIDNYRFNALEKENDLNIKKIEELKNEIEVLDKNKLRMDVVKQLSLELLDDLQTQNISEEDFIKEAKNYFSSEDSIRESWEKLNGLELRKLLSIEENMKENNVANDDILVLDDIENFVQYKYIIIKGLKIVFYRFLEQKNIQNTIVKQYT